MPASIDPGSVIRVMSTRRHSDASDALFAMTWLPPCPMGNDWQAVNAPRLLPSLLPAEP